MVMYLVSGNLTIFLILNFLHAVFSATPQIGEPANGSIINPGASFPFLYYSIADYSVPSYNYTVWMFTQPPTSFVPQTDFAVGYYFGRYGQPNYFGNWYPPNPPPKNLTMPDLAALGAHAHNATFYLTVIEEYRTGNESLGYRMSLTYNHIRYNAT